MPWHVRSPEQLSDAERSAWDGFQRTQPLLDSPYFRPEWCDALAAVGRPVEIAVATEKGEPRAFFAYEKDGRTGHPTGRMINDYQGVVGDEKFSFDPLELLRETGLSSLHFDHMLAGQTWFGEYHEQCDSSPYIDLSNGLESYQASLTKSGRSDASTARRKSRKLEREVGELRFAIHDPSEESLAALFRWKSAQYADTGVPDIFANDWTRDLLTNLCGGGTPEFAGQLTTLTAGDKLVAVHFGIRSQGVLHWWFPTYDAEFGKYSPGRVLLQKLIDDGPELGLTKIDLGKGMSSYKQRTMSHATPLAVGIVENAPLKRLARQSTKAAKDWLKKTPLRKPLSVPARWLHHQLSRRAMN